MIYFKMHLEYAVTMTVRPKKMPYTALVIGDQTPKRPRPALDVADLADDGAMADDEATPKKEKQKKKPKPAGKAKAPQAPPKSPKPEPKPTSHAGAAGGGGAKGDASPPRRPEGGSAFPDSKFLARNDIEDSLPGIIQAKIDQSNGIDKGVCAWCLFGPNGPHDRQVGRQAPCGRAHMGPVDRKPPLCIAACKTPGLEGPLYLINNKKLWTASLSGHSAAEAKPKAKPTGGRKSTPAPSEDDDDDDDNP